MVEVHSLVCSSRWDKSVAAPLLLVFDTGKQSGSFEKSQGSRGAVFWVEKRGNWKSWMDGNRGTMEKSSVPSIIAPNWHRSRPQKALDFWNKGCPSTWENGRDFSNTSWNIYNFRYATSSPKMVSSTPKPIQVSHFSMPRNFRKGDGRVVFRDDLVTLFQQP